jgi:hypothetical protein
LEIDNSAAHTGAKSLKVVGITATGTPSHTKLRYGPIPVEGDGTFNLTFWAKVDTNEGMEREVEVSMRLDDELWPGDYRNKIILNSPEWKKYSDTFTVITDIPTDIWVGLSIAQSDVDFWVDDFKLVEVEQPSKAVAPYDKAPTLWGSIKSGYK